MSNRYGFKQFKSAATTAGAIGVTVGMSYLNPNPSLAKQYGGYDNSQREQRVKSIPYKSNFAHQPKRAKVYDYGGEVD